MHKLIWYVDILFIRLLFDFPDVICWNEQALFIVVWDTNYSSVERLQYIVRKIKQTTNQPTKWIRFVGLSLCIWCVMCVCARWNKISAERPWKATVIPKQCNTNKCKNWKARGKKKWDRKWMRVIISCSCCI